LKKKWGHSGRIPKASGFLYDLRGVPISFSTETAAH
jgi:hypothetical protein